MLSTDRSNSDSCRALTDQGSVVAGAESSVPGNVVFVSRWLHGARYIFTRDTILDRAMLTLKMIRFSFIQ